MVTKDQYTESLKRLNRDELKRKLNIYLCYKKQVDAELKELKQIEKELKADIMAHGENMETELGKAEIVKGYTQTSWDTKGLERYAKLAPRVLNYRRQKTIKPSVRIKKL
jgi:hypothetical protein